MSPRCDHHLNLDRHKAPRPRLGWLLAVAAAALLTMGCGSGPTTDAALSGLPLPAGASAANQPTVAGGTTTQSFQVSGQSPKQVMDFYAAQLPASGWAAVGTPGPSGATDYAGVFTKGNQKLSVSSSPFQNATQFNLQLSTG